MVAPDSVSMTVSPCSYPGSIPVIVSVAVADAGIAAAADGAVAVVP